jgi:hypothetical protein
MIDRRDVYAAIDSERDYQEDRWGKTASSGRLGNGDRTIDEFVLYMVGYANRLANFASISDDAAAKLECVRKLTTLGVACMEQHGAPPRQDYDA